MLMGYATNGQGYEALALFNEMRNAGIRPTGITFTGVLSACDHCGLVEDGRKWFNAMKWDYHIDPEIEHYSCMVDLFARAGCLAEAVKLIEQMPFEADASMWSSVLRGAYVQLSSIFATSGEWEKSSLVRKVMRQRQVKKNPGYSWADAGLQLHVDLTDSWELGQPENYTQVQLGHSKKAACFLCHQAFFLVVGNAVPRVINYKPSSSPKGGRSLQ
ncbi:hypothetical protein Patl1_08197 [Pistacia atlantica]|uniref:Uncharacterized protein n=1 Tax=Pistacia atlantica TaxID=434234 RepID=A0ACC1AJI8_9ROSI|nr:hypothetical protein Patl1_08197 [Pistacia atlantica]